MSSTKVEYQIASNIKKLYTFKKANLALMLHCLHLNRKKSYNKQHFIRQCLIYQQLLGQGYRYYKLVETFNEQNSKIPKRAEGSR